MIKPKIRLLDIPIDEIGAVKSAINNFTMFDIPKGKEICLFHNKYLDLPPQPSSCRPCIIKAKAAVSQFIKENSL